MRVQLAVLLHLILLGMLGGAAHAQETSEKCLEAQSILANPIGFSAEEIAYFEALRAEECKGSSDGNQPVSAPSSAAQEGITSMLQMLRDEGIDIDARMSRAGANCREQFASGALPAGAASREEAIRGCTVARQQVVYAEAINEMNANRQSGYDQAKARHDAQVAEAERRRQQHERELQERERRIAAQRAAREREMAEWRRAVELCRQGKREYCAKSGN